MAHDPVPELSSHALAEVVQKWLLFSHGPHMRLFAFAKKGFGRVESKHLARE